MKYTIMFSNHDDSSFFPWGQDWLTEPMGLLGYSPYNHDGICEAVALLSIQAWLARDFDRYYKRLKLIRSMPEDEYWLDQISQLESKRSRLIAKATDQARKGHKLDPLEQQQWKHTLAYELKELRQSVERNAPETDQKKVWSEAKNKLLLIEKALDELSEEEQIKLEIPVFFEAAEINYNSPDDLLPAEKSFDINARFSLFLSQSIEKQGGIYSIPTFSGIYNTGEVDKYISSLTKAIEEQSLTEPFCLLMANALHAISLHYNPDTRKWILTDAIRIFLLEPGEDGTPGLVSALQVAKEIMNSFECSDCVSFATTVYCTKDHKDKIIALVDKWKQTPEWKQIQEITPEKATSISDNKFTWLYVAAAENDTENVVNLLKEKGIDVNFPGSKGFTPLSVAIAREHMPIAKALLHHKDINPHLIDRKGYTSLHWATYKRWDEIIKLILECKNIDVNIRDHAGDLPLLHIIEDGDGELTELFFNKGADVDLPISRQVTPLFLAAQEGYSHIVKLCIERNADMTISFINEIDSLRNFSYEHDVVEKMEALIDKKNPDGNLYAIPISPAEIASIMGHDGIADLINTAEGERSQLVYFKVIQGINQLMIQPELPAEQIVALLQLKSMILDINNHDKTMDALLAEWCAPRLFKVPESLTFFSVNQQNIYQLVRQMMTAFGTQKAMEIAQPSASLTL